MKTLRDRLRISNKPPSTRFGVRFAAKIEGVTILMSRTSDGLIDGALARLERGGITAETPTWEILAQLKAADA